MSLVGKTTTNNVAEILGLIHTLSHAVEKRIKGIHVIGDRDLILGWMRDEAQPWKPIYEDSISAHDGLLTRAKSPHEVITTDATIK